MDGVLGFLLLIAIVAVIMFLVWIKDKVVDGVATGVNRAVQSGNHHLGQEMIAEEIQATTTASPIEVISTVLSVLNLPDHKPTTVSAGLFAVADHEDNDAILFGAGGITGVSFTALMVIEATAHGTEVGYTVVEWRIDSGVVSHAKLMSTLSQGIRFALSQLPNVEFTTGSTAGDGPSIPAAKLETLTAATAPAAEVAPAPAPAPDIDSEVDADAVALANTATDASSLAEIAARRPDLWAEISAHPSVYPELLAWITQSEEPSSDSVVVGNDEDEREDAEDLDRAAVTNSATGAATLAGIAGRRPDLWPTIMNHPAAYTDLLNWMAEQSGSAADHELMPQNGAS